MTGMSKYTNLIKNLLKNSKGSICYYKRLLLLKRKRKRVKIRRKKGTIREPERITEVCRNLALLPLPVKTEQGLNLP